jgi:hypothetical protein
MTLIRLLRSPVLVLRLGASIFLIGTAIAVCQDLTPELRTQIDRIGNLHRNLINGRANSPGAKLRAKEVSRTRADGGVMVGYELFADGFTANRFDLITVPITPKAEPVGAGTELSLEKDGQVMDGPNDPRVLFFPNFVPGEPARIGLLTKDGKERAFVVIVPNPIEASDHGCTLKVTRLLPKFEFAFVEGSGFTPNSDVELQANSMGEVHNGKLKSDVAGMVQTGILPFVDGRAEGQIQVSLLGKPCNPRVTFHWGTISE